MKFYADSSNIDEITKLKEHELIQGVTTNPTLIAMEESNHTRHWHEVIKEICDIVQGPVSAEVTHENHKFMLDEGRELARIDDHVVVKLPCTPDGMRTCANLYDEGISVNMTLCFSVAQAQLAENAGADYISPFLGRMDDNYHVGGVNAGVELVRDIYEARECPATNILAASIRSVEHINQVAKYASIATCPPKIIWEIFKHKLTLQGVERFMTDWKKVK
jgi:transaldolase